MENDQMFYVIEFNNAISGRQFGHYTAEEIRANTDQSFQLGDSQDQVLWKEDNKFYRMKICFVGQLEDAKDRQAQLDAKEMTVDQSIQRKEIKQSKATRKRRAQEAKTTILTDREEEKGGVDKDDETTANEKRKEDEANQEAKEGTEEDRETKENEDNEVREQNLIPRRNSTAVNPSGRKRTTRNSLDGEPPKRGRTSVTLEPRNVDPVRLQMEAKQKEEDEEQRQKKDKEDAEKKAKEDAERRDEELNMLCEDPIGHFNARLAVIRALATAERATLNEMEEQIRPVRERVQQLEVEEQHLLKMKASVEEKDFLRKEALKEARMQQEGIDQILREEFEREMAEKMNEEASMNTSLHATAPESSAPTTPLIPVRKNAKNIAKKNAREGAVEKMRGSIEKVGGDSGDMSVEKKDMQGKGIVVTSPSASGSAQTNAGALSFSHIPFVVFNSPYCPETPTSTSTSSAGTR